jgi:Rod binding domain-containing protein
MSLKKLAKSGMFGVAGLAAANPKIANKIARSGGLGLAGMMLAKKKKAAEAAGGMRGRPMMEDIMVGQEAPTGMRGRPVMNEVMMAEEAPAMRKGGKVKKMAKGGSTASKRGDGCATKGKTKGRFI